MILFVEPDTPVLGIPAKFWVPPHDELITVPGGYLFFDCKVGPAVITLAFAHEDLQLMKADLALGGLDTARMRQDRAFAAAFQDSIRHGASFI